MNILSTQNKYKPYIKKLASIFVAVFILFVMYLIYITNFDYAMRIPKKKVSISGIRGVLRIYSSKSKDIEKTATLNLRFGNSQYFETLFFHSLV